MLNGTGLSHLPLVTVVVPYHNEGPLVEHAIASIHAQSYQGPIEIIIVDDASSIAPPSGIASAPNVRVIRSQKNGGAPAARNLGLREARGSLVAFLDSDDVFLPDKLSSEVALLTSHHALIFVGTDGYLHRPNETYWISPFVRACFPTRSVVPVVLPEGARRAICLQYAFTTAGFMTRRSALELIGGFDETLRWGEEWDLQVRLAQLGPIGYIPTPTFRYLCRLHSITSTQHPAKQESAAAMSRRWRKTIPGLTWSQRHQLRRREHYDLLLAAQLHLELLNCPRLGLACVLRAMGNGLSMWGFRSAVRMMLCSLLRWLSSRSESPSVGT